jgi:hypothetical protein
MKNVGKYLGWFFLFLLFYSCTTTLKMPKKAYAVIKFSQNKKFLSNPRYVKGKLIITVTKTGKATKDSNNAVYIWSPNIEEMPNQKIIQAVEYSAPLPVDIFEDRDYGNEIAFWNLTDALEEKDSLKLERTFAAIIFDYNLEADSNLITAAWKYVSPELIKFYTREEPFLEQTPKMKELVDSLLSNTKNPLTKARKIFTWIRENMKYAYPPKNRGAKTALNSLKGDCGQYTTLFVSLCRIAGIPARQRSGFHFVQENTGLHVWAEIFLPPYGWVPVDATRENGFGKIGNDLVTASIGTNIPLKHSPLWANYSNSEIEKGRTFFMQMSTLAARGINVNVSTRRIVLKSELIK